ncbi:hypothetical protein [Marinobacter sp. MBR-105]|jgi:hypothetical protein
MTRPVDSTTSHGWKDNSQPDQARIAAAEKRVHGFLNYGGIHLEHTPAPGILTLEYQQGDLKDEIGNMRGMADALNELADALEGVPRKGN